jgi:competence protein ComEC
MKKIIFFTVLIATSLLALYISESTRLKDKLLHVIFCDVGQGDGVYIRTPEGSDIVIDGGPDNSILLCLRDNMPFWDRTIELVILTHPDADHYTGLVSIEEHYSIKSFATSFTQKDTPGYQTLSDELLEQGSEQRVVCQGDKFSFKEGIRLDVVWPKSCALGSTDKNDNSVVTLLTYKELQILLTGDAEEHIGDFYQADVGDIDILKVPHHGSKDGVDEDYLEALKPEVAILSVGSKNRYKHPSAEIMELLEQSNIKTYRTDRQGSIRISSDGESFNIAVEKN